MAKRKYQHTELYKSYKSGAITREQYLSAKATPKPRKKYDTSNRVGVKRGQYTGWTQYQKAIKEAGIRPGAKVPQTRAEYEKAFNEQISTPLKGGTKVSRKQAVEFLVMEATYSQKQIDAILDNVNRHFQELINFIRLGIPENIWRNWTIDEIDQQCQDLSDDYEIDLATAVLLVVNSPQEFWNWKLQASDVRGNTLVWQYISNIVDYQDEWDDVYGS